MALKLYSREEPTEAIVALLWTAFGHRIKSLGDVCALLGACQLESAPFTMCHRFDRAYRAPRAGGDQILAGRQLRLHRLHGQRWSRLSSSSSPGHCHRRRRHVDRRFYGQCCTATVGFDARAVMLKRWESFVRIDKSRVDAWASKGWETKSLTAKQSAVVNGKSAIVTYERDIE